MSTITDEAKLRLLNGTLDITKMRRWGIRVRVERTTSARSGAVKLCFLLIDEETQLEFAQIHEADVCVGDTVTILELDKLFTVIVDTGAAREQWFQDALRSLASSAEDVDPR